MPGEVPEADNEAVPLAPLKHRCAYFLDDGPHSEIREEGNNEVAVSEVLGEFHGFYIGVHEDLYLYYFAPLIPELLSYPTFWRTVDVSHPVSFSREAVAKLAMEIPRRNFVRLSVSAVYDEYQKGKTRNRRPFYTHPPWLVKKASRATSFSSFLPGDAEAAPSQDLQAGIHRRLLGEVFFLRTQVRDMVAQRDFLVQPVRAFARWDLMREWLEKRIDQWDPTEEYRCYPLLLGGVDRADTLRSVVGSRFSEGPLP
ncbi:hypothetical protein Bca101_025682 [Brassica carinata]